MNDDFKKLLKISSFGLNALSIGLHHVAKNLEAFADADTKEEKPEPPTSESPPKPSPKAQQRTTTKTKEKKTAASSPKNSKQTDTDIILGIIVNAKGGIDIHTIARETGFPNRKISDTVHRLKRQGKVKMLKPGVYAKA